MQIYKLSVCGGGGLLVLAMCCNIARPQGGGMGAIALTDSATASVVSSPSRVV